MSNLYITVGAPGSGKSTWVESFKINNPHVTFISSDHLRSIFGRDENDQSVSAQVFRHMESEVDRLLSENKDVCIDATNMHLKARKPWVQLSKKHNAILHAYVFIVDRQVLIERNQNRGKVGGRNVPVDVIDRMLNNYVTPSESEGFNQIFYV